MRGAVAQINNMAKSARVSPELRAPSRRSCSLALISNNMAKSARVSPEPYAPEWRSCSLGLVTSDLVAPLARRQFTAFSLPCLGEYHWLRTRRLIWRRVLRSSLATLRHSGAVPSATPQRHWHYSGCGTAGAARELAKGSPTAAVIAVETRRFAEGNGLSRLIGLRVAVVATPVAYGSGDTRSDAAPQRRRSSGDTRSDAAW